MRAQNAIALLALLLTGLDGPAAAGAPSGAELGTVTVDEVLAHALRENPELAALRAEIEAGRGRVTQAGLRPNPMLEIGGQKALGPDSNLGVALTLPLDLNGRKEGRVGVAERELETRRAQLADRERRLRAEVRGKVGDLLAASRDVHVADDLLGVNREALRLLGERARRGAIPPLEESLLLVEVNRLDAQRRMLQSRVDVLALEVNALAAYPAEAIVAVRGDLSEFPAPPDRAEAIAGGLAGRPDLVMARADAATARARVAKEQAEGRWDASVSVGYQRQDMGFSGLSGITSTGGTRPIQDVFHYFGGGVTVMLPVRNRNEGNVAAARAESTAADRRVELAQLVIRQEVASAFAQYEAARESLAIYERGVRDVAGQNLQTVRRSYELGRTTLLDVIAEQRRYIEIETGYTEALKRVYGAAVEIERSAGRP
ncbi:MAG TPA: TolC family protein [Candidatus Binatia bacterium]|nr:TolC family protein [Candidatus Binatia bacterium]